MYLISYIYNRLTPEAKANRPQLAHMPFGWGPRNCIGLRFALLEALIEVLKKFRDCGMDGVVLDVTGIGIS